MTFAEFRAWFDGYCEHVGDAPTPEQWARIKEKMAEVERAPPAIVVPYVPTSPTVAPSWGPYQPYPLATCGGSSLNTLPLGADCFIIN